MDIKINTVRYDIGKERCYVHARGLMLPDGFGIMTMQKLELAGCDLFHGIEMIKTFDGGKSFTSPVPCAGLARRYNPDGTSSTICDCTPFYHKGTGKIILTGHIAHYYADGTLPGAKKPRFPVYAVYNNETGDFDSFREIELPVSGERSFAVSGAGCTQIAEDDNSDLLIPIYYSPVREDGTLMFEACVLRCSFDGEKIHLIEIGAPLSIDVPRGFCEPSVVKHDGEYLLALRNDLRGYVAKSADGLSYGEIKPLEFDDGEELGSYNTQQHWLTGGGRLWLVYTRRAKNNAHVFRHRAPLFIAEFDTERMCVIRDTERIAVPERGARLGNFGCQSFSDEVGYVFASEWMQGKGGVEGCMKYGSDNTIFISKITY